MPPLRNRVAYVRPGASQTGEPGKPGISSPVNIGVGRLRFEFPKSMN
jgi:hypothetical protein